MTLRALLSAVVLVGFARNAPAAPPDTNDLTGAVKWAEKHPKPYPAADDQKPGVEVLGTYKVPAGWSVSTVQLDYIPRKGGTLNKVETVKLQDGEFGAVDPKTKKVVSLKVPVEPGEWTMRVLIIYQWKDGNDTKDVAVTTSWEHVEVK